MQQAQSNKARFAPRKLAHVRAVLTTAMLIASTAWSHTLLTTPVPRNNRDDLKDGNGGAPCGGVARTTDKVATWTMGATVDVKWNETVNHAGCFLIKLSPANDQNFQLMKNEPHKTQPAITAQAPRPYSTTITLPAGMTCESCTLQLIQIMDTTMPCPPAVIPAGASYYSCADVKIVAPAGGTGGGAAGTGGGTAGAGGSGGGSAGGSAGGAEATGGSGGGGEAPGAGGGEAEMNESTGKFSTLNGGPYAEGGCSSAAGALSGLTLLALVAAIRRRRP